jgi:hypothetical protein
MAAQHSACIVLWSLVRSVVSIIRYSHPSLTMHSGRIFPGLLDQRSFRHATIHDFLVHFGAHGPSDYDTANGQSWRTVPLGA